MLQQAASTLQAAPRQVDINQATARRSHSLDASICDPFAPAQVQVCELGAVAGEGVQHHISHIEVPVELQPLQLGAGP